MKNEVKPASSAAPRAGTIWKESVCESRVISGATRIPSPPATTLPSAVFTTASSVGDRPTSIAETSFSDAALVESPKGVQRYSAASAAATAITMPARMNRSIGTTKWPIITVLEGRIDLADFDVSPKTSITPASKTSRRPSEAANRASGDAFRSGRKTSSSVPAPSTAMNAIVRMNAGAVESWKPK